MNPQTFGVYLGDQIGNKSHMTGNKTMSIGGGQKSLWNPA